MIDSNLGFTKDQIRESIHFLQLIETFSDIDLYYYCDAQSTMEKCYNPNTRLLRLLSVHFKWSRFHEKSEPI